MDSGVDFWGCGVFFLLGKYITFIIFFNKIIDRSRDFMQSSPWEKFGFGFGMDFWRVFFFWFGTVFFTTCFSIQKVFLGFLLFVFPVGGGVSACLNQ